MVQLPEEQADWTLMSPLTPQLRLHDRYVLHDRVGLGGMSEVWRAEDEVLGRLVAVKVLAGTFAVDPELRAVIRREARAAARLAHPHITQVYDYGEATLAGGIVPYLVMELVDGRNLADRLAEGPLPWPSAVRTAAEIAAALAAAHRIGVVHRDIKPGNVMLTETGAKVLDFGIAALAGPQHVGAGHGGEPLMGTPAYTAPERLRAGTPDPASDVYGLGVLLHRTLTGEVPLPVRSWEEAARVHARRPPVAPPRVPGLPAAVATLVLACLEPDPSRRPTAAQLAGRFRAAATAAAGHSTAAPTGPVGHSSATLPMPTDEATALVTPPAPTLVDRTDRWYGPTQPTDAPASTRPPRPHASATGAAAGWSAGATPSAGSVRSAAHGWTTPGRLGHRSGDPQRRRPPAGVLVAAGVAALIGLGAIVALGGDGEATTPIAAPSSAPAAPAAASTSASPAAPRPSPSTAAPEPVSLRQTAAEFVALITEAQLVGDIDRKAAERLRKDLTELALGRPKDREDRIEDLRDRIEDEVERGRVPVDFGERLDDLLDQLEATLPEED